MDAFLEGVEYTFNVAVQLGIVLMESLGVAIILYTGIKSVVLLLRSDEHVRLKLAKGIALALEFKLGSEVLRTTIVREWSELAVLGAIIILRGLLTFLIHWEIKNEEAHLV